jgi:hypothetical protein
MACTTVYYWLGTTQERFTIPNTIVESTDITIDPNSGSNVGGTHLDYGWIMNNFNVVNRFMFKEAKAVTFNISDNDVHALIIIPSVLKVENISEIVFGQQVLMTEAIHFDSFSLSIGGKSHTAYYLRDLTRTVFPPRQFYFEISINA